MYESEDILNKVSWPFIKQYSHSSEERSLSLMAQFVWPLVLLNRVGFFFWKAIISAPKIKQVYWIFCTMSFKRTVFTFVVLLTQWFSYLNDELSKYRTCGKESRRQKADVLKRGIAVFTLWDRVRCFVVLSPFVACVYTTAPLCRVTGRKPKISSSHILLGKCDKTEK
jgi:Ni,Fe-hydrogenase I cytochrome b subunit